MASDRSRPDNPGFEDNPEWTEEDFSKAKPASEVLPPELFQALKRNRGPGKHPLKTPVSIRLSQRVLDHYRSQGAGWQTRLNADLEAMIGKKHPG